MFLVFVVCFLIVGMANNVISIMMKIRVNEALPEDQRLTWWSRNFREVNRIYRTRHPDSILPDLDRYSYYLVIALFVGLIVAGIVSRN